MTPADTLLALAGRVAEPCGYCGREACVCDATDLCAVPGCDNRTERGICGACDTWVTEQAAALRAAPASGVAK